MAKTKSELDELKNEYEAVKSKLEELSDDELKEVSGGGSSDNVVVVCSYQCPICGSTHTFNMEFHGIFIGFDVISFNACSKTREVIKIKAVDYPTIQITSSDGQKYTVSYKEERIAL